MPSAAGETYRKYLLAVLAVILASNYVDRYALGLLLQDIKLDLQLSDTQLGFLTGMAFAVFYSVLGIPIARWADRGNRISIIAVTTLLWSAAVALCGWANSFAQLLLIRIGVAVGEAGCTPPAHSLIADHFTRAERPRAVARYKLGWPLSVLIGYFFAGWLNELYGWRMTFVLLGSPGLILAALAWFTLREPRVEQWRQAAPAAASESDAVTKSSQPSLQLVAQTLWANTTFRHLLLYFSVLSFFGYGITQWQPAFFMRSFGLQTGELGTWFALIHGGGGLLGVWLGGELASRYAVHNERVQLKAMGLIYGVFGLVSAGIYLSPNPYLAFALMGIGSLAVSTVLGPLLATIQTLVPDRMRAISIAIIYLFANLVGMGLGPVVAGVLSDAFQSWAGEESLRYSLLALSPGYLWGGWHLWRAAKTVREDLERARRINEGLASPTVLAGSARVGAPSFTALPSTSRE
jgi:MFS family permease